MGSLVVAPELLTERAAPPFAQDIDLNETEGSEDLLERAAHDCHLVLAEVAARRSSNPPAVPEARIRDGPGLGVTDVTDWIVVEEHHAPEHPGSAARG